MSKLIETVELAYFSERGHDYRGVELGTGRPLHAKNGETLTVNVATAERLVEYRRHEWTVVKGLPAGAAEPDGVGSSGDAGGEGGGAGAGSAASSADGTEGTEGTADPAPAGTDGTEDGAAASASATDPEAPAAGAPDTTAPATPAAADAPAGKHGHRGGRR